MRTLVVDHPLVAHKLTVLRDKNTPSPVFRQLTEELVTLLAYEATREVRTQPVTIETPVSTTVVIGVLVYIMCLQFEILWARITAIAAGVIFIIAMGLSRVFLGHHWLTDVMAGWFLGLAWVGVVILAHRLFHLLRKREHAGPAPTFEHPVLRDDQTG